MEKNIINVVFIVILIFSHTLIYGFDLHEDVDSEDAIWGTRVPQIAPSLS